MMIRPASISAAVTETLAGRGGTPGPSVEAGVGPVPPAAAALSGKPVTKPFRGSVTLAAAGLAMLGLLIATTTGFIVLQSRTQALRYGEHELRGMALTLADQAERTFEAVDLVQTTFIEVAKAEGIQTEEEFRRRMSMYEIHQQLEVHGRALPQLQAIGLVDAGGQWINSNSPWPVHPFNVSDRRYFKDLKDNQDRFQVTGDLIVNRVTHTPSIVSSHKVVAPDGRFLGIAFGGVATSYFDNLYKTLLRDDASAIALIRADGMFLTRYPDPKKSVGKILFHGAAAERLAQSGLDSDVTIQTTLADGMERMVAAHKLRHYPMLVAVSTTTAALLRQWRTQAESLIAAATALELVVAAVSVLMLRQFRAQRLLADAQAARYAAEAALMGEREQAAEAESKAKSGFLAMMSHEIRTPMNGVLGLAGTLCDMDLTETQRKVVDAILVSGDSLMRILNDILDFSKLDAGRLQFERTAFSPGDLTRDPASLLGAMASAKGLTFETAPDENLPAAVLGDPGRLRQVLLNLASNAVKFTERGKVTVHAACPERDEIHATIVWTVSDTGIGIPAERLGRLFREFFQADSSITRRFGGSGLGLAISKRIVEQMGGTITVESVPNKGSAFQVTVRMAIAETVGGDGTEPANVREEFTRRIGRLGRPARILVAEDNATNQLVIKMLLRGLDVHVDLVGDGLEAVRAASSLHYDAICMDMQMPEMDGLEATRKIRAMGGALAAIPIIALTANAFPDDVAACHAAGMNGFVAKPVTRDSLLAGLLRAMANTGPDGRSDLPPAGAAETDEVVDPDALAELQEELGADGLAEVVSAFVIEARTLLAAIGASGGDRETLTGHVHSLKAAAAAVHAVALSNRASRLEARLRDGGMLDPADLRSLTQAFSDWAAEMHVEPPGEALAA